MCNTDPIHPGPSLGAFWPAVFAALLGMCVEASPVSPQVVKDLDAVDARASSGAGFLARLAPGVALLTAYRPTVGRELYRFDEASGEIALVRDINPGPGSPSISTAYELPLVIGGVAYFQAFEPSTGAELWRSDGTPEGTRLVRDVWLGFGGAGPSQLSRFGNGLLFNACSDVGACSVWYSDGTETGTTPFLGGRFRNLVGVGELGGRWYLGADAGDGLGIELWSTDGSLPGTALVKDIAPGSFGSGPSDFVAVDNELFFSARDVNGIELWKSDGTTAGTAMVKDLWPGTTPWGDPNSGNPFSLIEVGGQLVFQARTGPGRGYSLWRSDGTENGTVRIREVDGGVRPCTSSNYSWNSHHTVVANRWYFSGAIGAAPCALLTTDGSDAGTTVVKDGISIPSQLTRVGDLLFFVADDGVHGGEIWRSDGTDPGTYMVRDIMPPPEPWEFPPPSPGGLGSTDTLLLFSADDGTHGGELWRSDGTPAGTWQVEDLWSSTADAMPAETVEMNGFAYFSAREHPDGNFSLWRTDGTEAGTLRLLEPEATGCYSSIRNVGQLTVVGDRFFFSVTNCASRNFELWQSDGTPDGTLPVATAVEFGFSYVSQFAAFRGSLYFTADSEANPERNGWWRSDGTAAGTVLVRGDIYPNAPTVAGDLLFFAAEDREHGAELWRSDGTAAGTVLVKDIYPGSSPNSSYPRQLKALGNQLLFFAGEPVTDLELWRSDGTESGTSLVKDICVLEYSCSALPSGDLDDLSGAGAPVFTEYRGKLWFFAYDAEAGFEPWSTDGTPAGTTRLKDISPGPGSSGFSYYMWGLYPSYSGPRFAVLNDALYFGADQGSGGFGLWRSDGTEAGTRRLKEMLPTDGSRPNLFDSFTATARELYFIGCQSNGYDGFRDCNLWKTDGTESGTELALSPGLRFDGGRYYFTGNSRIITAAGNLLVPGTDDEHGAELFRIPVARPPQVTPSVAGTRGLGDWFVSDVAVTWNIDAGGLPVSASQGCEPTVVNSDTTGRELRCTVTIGGGSASAAVTIRRDATAPTIDLAAPRDAGSYLTRSEPLLADYKCADTTSGILGCVGDLPNGGTLDMTGVGEQMFQAEATDNAGNVATRTSHYRLVYGFSGFLAPLGSGSNDVQAGRIVPVRWKLWDGQSQPVGDPQAVQSLVSASAPCGTTTGAIAGEPALAMERTQLRYLGAAQQFIFNWATSPEWRGCRLLQLTLGDGTRQFALFNFHSEHPRPFARFNFR